MGSWGERGQSNNWPYYHSTDQIIEAIKRETFPNKAMMTFHPQRWTDHWLPWGKELVWQNVKNVVKRLFFVRS